MSLDHKKVDRRKSTTGVSITLLPDGKIGDALVEVLSKNETVELALQAAKEIRAKHTYRGMQWLTWNGAISYIEFALEHGANLSGFLKQGENVQDRDPSER